MAKFPRPAYCLSALLLCVVSLDASAAYKEFVYQDGPDVLTSGSGTVNTNALSNLTFGLLLFNSQGFVSPANGAIVSGDDPVNFAADALSPVTGPANFGSGPFKDADAGSGGLIGVGGVNKIYLPNGYVSNTPLTSTSRYNGTSLAAPGLTPGTYVWSWGTGADADTYTLVIGTSPAAAAAAASVNAVPTLSDYGYLMTAGLLAALGWARTRRAVKRS